MAGYVAGRQGHFVAWIRADWERFGRAAGMRRNEQLLQCVKPDVVIAFWDGKSPGTRNMIEHARAAGVRVAVFTSATLEPASRFSSGRLKRRPATSSGANRGGIRPA